MKLDKKNIAKFKQQIVQRSVAQTNRFSIINTMNNNE